MRIIFNWFCLLKKCLFATKIKNVIFKNFANYTCVPYSFYKLHVYWFNIVPYQTKITTTSTKKKHEERIEEIRVHFIRIRTHYLYCFILRCANSKFFSYWFLLLYSIRFNIHLPTQFYFISKRYILSTCMRFYMSNVQIHEAFIIFYHIVC